MRDDNLWKEDPIKAIALVVLLVFILFVGGAAALMAFGINYDVCGKLFC